MNRRSFLKWTGASVVATTIPLPTSAVGKTKIPYIMILQPLSPHIYGVAGAAAGMLMNTKTDEVFDSIEFVPCHTQHLYLEWRNRQGYTDSGYTASSKLVGTHKWDSDIVKTAMGRPPAQYKDATSWQLNTPAGNRLVETYYLYGLQVHGDKVVTPCMLAFSGANIKAYKNLMKVIHLTPSVHGQLMKVKPPLYAYKLRISTTLTVFERKNAKTSFYNFRIDPAKGNWEICWDSMSVDVTNTLLHPDHPLLKAAVKLRKWVRA